MAGGPSSPIGSVAMFGVGGSRGEGSASPVTSPMLPVEHTNKDAVRGEEWSDVGSDEEKKGGRMFCSLLLLFYVTQHVCGIHEHLVRSCMLSLYCIT